MEVHGLQGSSPRLSYSCESAAIYHKSMTRKLADISPERMNSSAWLMMINRLRREEKRNKESRKAGKQEKRKKESRIELIFE